MRKLNLVELRKFEEIGSEELLTLYGRGYEEDAEKGSEHSDTSKHTDESTHTDSSEYSDLSEYKD